MSTLRILSVFMLVLVSVCQSGSSGNNFRNGYQLDYREIARQNKITEQILQNYLEKRLFPNNQRPSKAPTVWDILPRDRRKPQQNNIQDVLNSTETLESGESEQVSSFYDDIDTNHIDLDERLNLIDSGMAPILYRVLRLGENFN